MKSKKRTPRRRGWQIPVLLGLLLLLYHVFGAARPTVAESPFTAPSGGVLQDVALTGPDGPQYLGYGQPTIVHVWLQGCGDCMPAFEKMKEIYEQGGLQAPLPVLNVAYGRASKQWAEQYGLTDPLAFDPGQHVVRPLGIGTFTTLVVDGDGTVLDRVRPTQPDYLERIQAASLRTTHSVEPVPCGGEGFGVNEFTPPVETPWTLIAPLALFVIGAGWRLFPARLIPARTRAPKFASANTVGLRLQRGQRCPYCHEGLSKREDLTQCGECKTVYHLACAREASSCTTLGCVNFQAFVA